jgi:hypothetical protein
LYPSFPSAKARGYFQIVRFTDETEHNSPIAAPTLNKKEASPITS